MKKVYNIFINTVICLSVAMISFGCMLEKEGPSADNQSVMIELNVSSSDLTKATPTDAEKKIETLRIFAFSGERLAGHLYTEAAAVGESMFMHLELPETGSHPVDFYLIANEGEMAYQNGTVELSSNMTRAQIEAVKFTGIVTYNALPLWGYKNVMINVDNVKEATMNGHEGHLMLDQTVEFSLSRSLAKLSLYAAKKTGTASDPQILNVKLLAGGTREYSYLFPQEDDVLNAVVSRANDRDLFISTAVVDKEADASTQNEADYKQIFTGKYLPEVTYGSSQWNVASGEERAAVLHVEYNLGAGQERKNAYIYLPAIVRNTHLKVCIFINANGQIIVNYKVAEWDADDMWGDGGLQFSYPTHSYIRESVPVTDADVAQKPSKAAEMSEGNPFVCYFQMTAPANEDWTPTLLGVDSEKCEVKVYTMDGTSEITTRPIQASDDWYMIKVTPLTMIPGETVNLAITYKPIWSDLHEYLLINGSKNEYYWPYDGAAEDQDANYIIVTMK